MIRKATKKDIDAVERLYEEIHDAEEKGKQTIGWIRGIYPIRKTAEDALERNDLFVLDDEGKIKGTEIINQKQVADYVKGNWQHRVDDDKVCVLHTLVISPFSAGKGYGREFLNFYESYARKEGCTELRIDTNARNKAAREMYRKHRYQETGIVPTDFNGIPGIELVLLEKYIG